MKFSLSKLDAAPEKSTNGLRQKYATTMRIPIIAPIASDLNKWPFFATNNFLICVKELLNTHPYTIGNPMNIIALIIALTKYDGFIKLSTHTIMNDAIITDMMTKIDLYLFCLMKITSSRRRS
jgi:hypothetical protein